jgi:TRAP-type C4-dicarboxylate transport system substrate-binding protein
MKKLVACIVLLIGLGSAGALSAAEYTGKELNARLATADLEGDFITVWSHKFSEEMKDWSGGKINIDVYPYGSLGDTRDINELCQLGVIEFVVTDYAWISSFVPEAQVLGLHYLWPRERAPEVLAWIVEKGEFMNVLETAFRREGMVPLGLVWEDWMWITSKKPIKSMADLEGLKLRLMSSKVLVDQYKTYGASPTPMSFGEVYGGLQMGLIDAQMNPIFADYSMKFFEVTDYFVQMYNEAYIGIPTINANVFDSLPEDAQQKMKDFWSKSTIASSEWIIKRNQEDMEKIKAEKPSIEIFEFDEEEIAKIEKIAKSNYPAFLKIGGPDAQKALDSLQKDLESAKKELGL